MPISKSKTIAFAFSLIFLLTLVFIVVFPSSISAASSLEVNYPAINGPTPPSAESSLGSYINYIYHLSLIVGVLFCVGVIIYGGVSYFFAAGMVAKMLEARKWIYAGLLGLFILLGSWALLNTINPQFLINYPSVISPSTTPPTTRPSLVHTVIYREIPLGQLIDRVITEAEAKDGSFQKLLGLIKEVKTASKDLRDRVGELRDLLDNVKCLSNCGTGLMGVCAGTGKYGLNPPSPVIDSEHCSTQHFNFSSIPFWAPFFTCKPYGCEMATDTFATSSIIEKENEIKQAINTLQDRQTSLVLAQTSIISSYLSLRKAVQLMYTTVDLVNYYDFMRAKEEIEREKMAVVETKSFEGWPGVTSVARVGQLKHIQFMAEDLKDSLTPQLFKDINKKYVKTSWIHAKSIEDKSNSFIGDLQRATSTPKSTPASKATTTVLKQVEDKLPLFNEAADFIQDEATTAKNYLSSLAGKINGVLGTGNPLSNGCDKSISDFDGIYASTTDIKTYLNDISNAISDWKSSGDANDANTARETINEKASLIQNTLQKILSFTQDLLGEGKPLVDPATFYYPIREKISKKGTK